jgi:hypothetical protein
MPTTPRLQLPYPALLDTADVPRDLAAVVNKLDPNTTIFSQGTLAERPAAGASGRFYYATDQSFLYYDNGTAWTSASSGERGVLSASILEVGAVGQVRAGRQLSVVDFTDLKVTAPLGLWNLSDTSDASGNARVLINRGPTPVPFGVGINGLASTCAVFVGSTTQALYIVDSGAADPFRIATGSWGCWFRTAKRGAVQSLIGKWGGTGPTSAYLAYIHLDNRLKADYSDGVNKFSGPSSVTDVADDRWHFVVVTHDGGALRLYLDGVLEGVRSGVNPLPLIAAPLNIGAFGADAGVAGSSPHYGRIDEAFVTNEVLYEDQIRILYAARLTHTLGAAPREATLAVHRKRKGGAFLSSYFTTTPLRLYNFTQTTASGTAWEIDQGSNAVVLTAQGAGPVFGQVGADGRRWGGVGFNGAGSAATTDAGLPAGTAARSYGCWVKTSSAVNQTILGWGTSGAADARFSTQATGALVAYSGADVMTGPSINDGQWHLVIVAEDNAAASGDGVKRKLYLDGRLVAGSTVLNAITLAGALRFRVGAAPDGALPFTGQVDAVFVCGYAMAQDEVLRLWSKGGQDLGVNPKNVGDHIERLGADGVLFIGDTLEPQHSIDIGVVA